MIRQIENFKMIIKFYDQMEYFINFIWYLCEDFKEDCNDNNTISTKSSFSFNFFRKNLWMFIIITVIKKCVNLLIILSFRKLVTLFAIFDV
jgi:hypothetical protein